MLFAYFLGYGDLTMTVVMSLMLVVSFFKSSLIFFMHCILGRYHQTVNSSSRKFSLTNFLYGINNFKKCQQLMYLNTVWIWS